MLSPGNKKLINGFYSEHLLTVDGTACMLYKEAQIEQVLIQLESSIPVKSRQSLIHILIFPWIAFGSVLFGLSFSQ